MRPKLQLASMFWLLTTVSVSLAWYFEYRRAQEAAAIDLEHRTSREFVLRLLDESLDSLAYARYRKLENPSVLEEELGMKGRLLGCVWRMGVFEDSINDLNGPKASDLARLLLYELGINSDQDISAYYNMVDQELPEPLAQHEIRDFLVRSLAIKRNELLDDCGLSHESSENNQNNGMNPSPQDSQTLQ